MIRNRRYNLYDLHTEGLGNSFIKFSEKDLQTYIYAAHPIKKTSAEEFMESVLKKLLTQHMAERWMRRAEQDCQNSLLYVSTVSTQNRTMSLDSTKIPFADLPTDSKAVVIQAARKTSIKDQIIIDPQTQPSVILEEENPYDRYSSYRISHLGKGFVEIIYGKSFVRLNLSGEWRRRVSYYAADESEYYLSPLQVWAKSKTSGERFWLDEDLSTDLMEGVDTRANHRLGLILATTISDKERELLPYRLPLKPGGNMQYLKEAQMPVLPFLTVNDIRNLVGEDPQELIMDPHQTILNGAYFNAVERSVHFN